MGVFFVCPLCGRQRPVSGWDPLGYTDEITLRDGRGMGRTRGFEYSNERTAGDSTELDLEAVAHRCLEILKICTDTGAVAASRLVDYVPDQLVEEVVKEKAEDYGYYQSTEE